MNLSVFVDNDATLSFALKDANQNIIDLTGGSLTFKVTDWRKKEIFSKSSSDNTQINILDPSAGTCEVYITPTDTLNKEATTYLYYLNFTDSSSKVSTILQGNFMLKDLAIIRYITEKVRNFAGDKAELNTLLRTIETTDEEMQACIEKAVDFYNSFGYSTSYTLTDYPNMGNLIDGTVIQILMGKGILSARNMVTYQDNGGVTIQDMDVYGRYVNLFNILVSNYVRNVQSIKVSLNISGAYGGIESPWSILGNYYD